MPIEVKQMVIQSNVSSHDNAEAPSEPCTSEQSSLANVSIHHTRQYSMMNTLLNRLNDEIRER